MNRALAVLAALVLVIGITLSAAAWRTASRIEDQRDANAAVIRELAESVDALREQLLRKGETPIEPPADETIERGERGPIGPIGPRGPIGPPGEVTEAQVQRAVRSYLIENPPQRGRPPTQAEIGRAVDAFCAARGGCIGPEGPRGLRGAEGAAGDNATDAQVAAAVATFCADDACVGPQGPVGPRGEQGEKGEKGEPGPACPDGYTGQERDADGIPGGETWWVCVKDEPGEEEQP